MKNSVARKVTRNVSLLLLVAMILLLVGAYHLVSRIIREKSEQYTLAILGIYTDLLLDESRQKNIPIDAHHTDNIIRYGEYICDWYNVDYIYLYVPAEENGSVTYIAAAAADGKVHDSTGGYMVGQTVQCKLEPEELAVWRGEKFVGRIAYNNRYGNEVSTLLRVEDEFGNRAIAGVDTSYRDIREQILTTFFLLSVIVLAVLFGVGLAVYFILRRQVSKPAQQISRCMQDFITDGKRTTVKLKVGKSDEYSMIAAAFNSMTDDIDRYLENIGTLTAESANRQAELNIAAKIQQSFLPDTARDGRGYRIRAVMSPAKDVGGDFYDYRQIDEYRTLLVIADVSGKGVAAAMFMSVTMMLIRQYAKMGLSPDEILRRTNETLCERNTAMLFTTAFVGIYDCRDRSFVYSDAGHNPPYLVKNDGLQPLDRAAGTLLGLFAGEEYTVEKVSLCPGDSIFLYTDGVTEATDPERHFFGIGRLENALRECRASRTEDPVAFLQDAIRRFSGDAEQHDDLTMLVMTACDTEELLLRADIHEMKRVKEAVLALPVPRRQQLDLCLAAEECFVNICSYAFPDGTPEEACVRLTLSVSDRIEMRFEDGGSPYDPLQEVKVPEDYDPDIQMGGFGKLLSLAVTDDARYEYRDGKNILTLIKYREEESQ